MRKLFKKITYLLILISTVNCTDTKSQSEMIADSNMELDTVAVEEFLKDPRNNLALNKLEYTTECNLSENKKPNNLDVSLKEYYNCIYTFKGEKIAEMKSSVFKTDSTRALGTNGLKIYRFQTDQESFPLKNELKVGSAIQDFQELFGIPKKHSKDKYFYEFEFELFSSNLILVLEENIVTQITVANNEY